MHHLQGNAIPARRAVERFSVKSIELFLYQISISHSALIGVQNWAKGPKIIKI